MREIRFRAWDMKKKQMLTIFDSSVGSDWYLPSWKENYKVMQYTGLKDKNGTEIYEGDVVEYGNSEENGTGKVIYDNGSFVLDWLDLNEFSSPIRYFQCANELEIIGNIYENPELLGGAE